MIKLQDEVLLRVPGTIDRIGIYKEDLPHDDMVKIEVTHDRSPKGKMLKLNQTYFYLAHRKHVYPSKFQEVFTEAP